MNTIVSIAILTKNPDHTFFEALKVILSQKVDFIYEVIIVDSGSASDIVDNINVFPVSFYSINSKSFNFGLTRDYIFSLCNGDYIITISQDVVPVDSNWISDMIAPFCDHEVVCVQGKELLPVQKEIFYWERISYFYFTSECKKWINIHGCSLSFVNCAIRKSFWEKNKIGYTQFSEDKLFQLNVLQNNKKIFKINKGNCYHGHQYQLRGLFTRLTGEGIGWRTVGVRYYLSDAIKDILINRWMLKRAFTRALRFKMSFAEILFPILRPLLIFYGNFFLKIIK